MGVATAAAGFLSDSDGRTNNVSPNTLSHIILQQYRGHECAPCWRQGGTVLVGAAPAQRAYILTRVTCSCCCCCSCLCAKTKQKEAWSQEHAVLSEGQKRKAEVTRAKMIVGKSGKDKQGRLE